MLLLELVAFAAGAGTALSPCILPILPAILAAGSSSGPRRPVGVALGLSTTFAVTIVGVTKVLGRLSISSSSLRLIAVLVVGFSSLCVFFPGLIGRVEAALSRWLSFRPRDQRGDGLIGGLLLGGSLGIIYTPCAGPILAAAISIGAASGRAVLIGVTYAIGTGASMLFLSAAGRRLLRKTRRRKVRRGIQYATGGILLATALAMWSGFDISFDQLIARRIPNATLTSWLEHDAPVARRLAALSTPSRPRQASSLFVAGTETGAPPGLQNLGPAPAFLDTERWFNTIGQRPLTMAGLRGRVVLVDFWAYSCINCLRTIPYLRAWQARYERLGLTIVGIHTPEFPFEQDPSNLASAIRQLGIRYPVAQDNRYLTWRGWGVQNWPTEFLIDRRGHLRYWHIGEGDYGRMEHDIRALLTGRDRAALGALSRPNGVVTPSLATTPETYMGAARASGWLPRDPTVGIDNFGAGRPPNAGFAFRGTWRVSSAGATAIAHAEVQAVIDARNVYLVLGTPAGRPKQVSVFLDGRPAAEHTAGVDVHEGRVTVRGERLYSLVALPTEQIHELTLTFSPGVTGYAFSFG